TSADPSTPQTGTLTARWTYEGGQLVDETSRDYNFTGTGQTAFQVSKPDGWPTGNYRVEILYDGEVVQTRDFEVRKSEEHTSELQSRENLVCRLLLEK